MHYDPSGFPKIRKVGGEPQSPVKIDPIDALLYACDRMLAWERDGGGAVQAEAWLDPRYDTSNPPVPKGKLPDLVIG